MVSHQGHTRGGRRIQSSDLSEEMGMDSDSDVIEYAIRHNEYAILSYVQYLHSGYAI